MSGKGIPNGFAHNTSIDVLPQNVVPSETNAVVSQYLAEQGQLTQFTGFGFDPLEGSSYLQEKCHPVYTITLHFCEYRKCERWYGFVNENGVGSLLGLLCQA